jgi:3-phenylpropionate/trans-cinnamate dioxygenase ferredoxin reductase component
MTLVGGRLYLHLKADGRLVAAGGVGPVSNVARDIRLAKMRNRRRAHPNLGNHQTGVILCS